MKVFVTGGTGLIGSRVVALLANGGHTPRCLLRAGSRTHRIDHVAYEPVYGDMTDAASLRTGMAGCDAVIHLASPSSWDEIGTDAVEPVIIGGTKALVEAAAAVDGIRLVYVSSAAAVNGSAKPVVYDETAEFALVGSGLRYAEAKHVAERAVLESGLNAVAVCPGETYAPGDDEWITAGTIRDALHGWPVLAIPGGTSVAHADDVAEAIVAALTKGRAGERYILGGDNLTVKEIMRTALDAAGLRKPIVTVPAPVVRAIAKACVALRITPPLAPDLIGYAARYWFSTSDKAIAELGYRPRPARETIAAVVAWMRERADAPVEPGR
ncbi:MAG: NAD-dependent epimerase/dehydratase family protein [Mycobacteriaceae bacterium]|nr:NAD-dependent epimerase/dehydratase family protein [Mycobacteriaceae bacterium]